MKSSVFLPSSLAKALTPWHYVSATALVALTMFGSQPASAVMMDVESLPNGATGFVVKSISGNGQVLAGLTNGDPSYWSDASGSQTFPAFSWYWRNAANDVSSNGEFVVGAGRILAGGSAWGRALRWDTNTGTALELGTLGGGSSEAYGISDDGTVVVGTADYDPNAFIFGRAFRWENGAMVDLGALRQDDISVARGVSGDGKVVVGYSTNATLDSLNRGVENLSTSKAFRWDTTTATMIDLGTLDGASQAFAANRDGSVIVGNSAVAGNNHAVIWTAPNQLIDLKTLGGDASSAADVNADGSVVVGSSQIASGDYRAFRWTDATGMINLGVLAGEKNSYAVGVSDDGDTVVGTSGARSFIYSAPFPTSSGTMQDLAYLQTSLLRSASTVNHLVETQSRRLRDLARQQCVPNAVQSFCLGIGGSRNRADGDTNGLERNLDVATGLRVNEHIAVGATATLSRADLREQSAEQRNAFGLSVWGAYQQNIDTTGWNASASVAAGDSRNSFERGTGLTDVQRARAKMDMNSNVMRVAAHYGIQVGDSVVSPEVTLTHGKTTQNGFTERNVAFPLTVERSQTRETYATFGVRSATDVGAHGTLLLGVAAEALLKDDTPALEGKSAVPGLSSFKLTSPDKRRVIPVANIGYSHALNATSTVGGGLQLSQSRFDTDRPLFGMGVQYRYAF